MFSRVFRMYTLNYSEIYSFQYKELVVIKEVIFLAVSRGDCVTECLVMAK